MSFYSYQIFSIYEDKTLPKLLFSFIGLISYIAVATFFTFKNTNGFRIHLAVTFIFCTIWIYFLNKNKRKLNFKKGKFGGSLEFHNDYILIENRKISTKDIKYIDVFNPDFSYKYDLESIWKPHLSIGVKNQIVIDLKFGERMSVNFQQKFDNELIRSLSNIEHYNKLGILTNNTLNRIITNPFH